MIAGRSSAAGLPGAILNADEPLAVALLSALQRGEIAFVEQQLRVRPELAVARIRDAKGVERPLLHVVADWPGHFPNATSMVGRLAQAGADLDAPVRHTAPTGSPETPLHWAASCDDVAVLDALLDHGANIEAPGAVFTGGTAMSDAVIFQQWNAARRLHARGANTTVWQAAALGLIDRVEASCAATPAPTKADITNALWHACRGGQLHTARLLQQRGADVDWIGHDGLTPLDVARESGNQELITWLLSTTRESQ